MPDDISNVSGHILLMNIYLIRVDSNEKIAISHGSYYRIDSQICILIYPQILMFKQKCTITGSLKSSANECILSLTKCILKS